MASNQHYAQLAEYAKQTMVVMKSMYVFDVIGKSGSVTVDLEKMTVTDCYYEVTPFDESDNLFEVLFWKI